MASVTLAIARVWPSISVSLARSVATGITSSVSSVPATTSAAAVGASLTPPTRTVTRPSALNSPSLMLYVKVASPT